MFRSGGYWAAALIFGALPAAAVERTSMTTVENLHFIERFSAESNETLTLDRLAQEGGVHSFSIPEGVIVYHQKEDEWRSYKWLGGHEAEGRLLSLHAAGGGIWAVLDKGMVYVENGQAPRTFAFSTDVIAEYDGSTYLVTLEPSRRAGQLAEMSSGARRIRVVRYNGSTGVTDEISSIEPKDWGYLSSWAMHRGRFWLAFSRKAMSIDTGGKVEDLNRVPDFPSSPTHFEAVNDSLYAFADGCYKLDLVEGAQSNVRVRHLHGGARYGSFDSVAISADALFVLPSKAVWTNTILKVALKSGDEERVALPTHYGDSENPDRAAYFNSNLWLLSARNGVVAKLDASGHVVRYYPIKDGRLGRTKAFVEDDREIWFLSASHGISILEKATGRWSFLPLPWLYPGAELTQLTMNDRYAFVVRFGENGGIGGYLLVDRKTKAVEPLNDSQLMRRFVPDRPETSQLHAWTALLFSLGLPLSGVDRDFSGIMSFGAPYSFLSIYSWKSPTDCYMGIQRFDRIRNRVEVFKLPRQMEFLDTGVVPLRIVGAGKMVWGMGYGHDSRGVFSYDLERGLFVGKASWSESLKDFWSIGQNDKNVFFGMSNAGKFLGVMNKETGEVTAYGSEVGLTAVPFTIQSTKRHDFFGTEDGLVYFDHERNAWGRKFDRWTTVHSAAGRVYAEVSGGTFYEIVEQGDAR